MNSLPPNAAIGQWRVAWLSVLAAGFSLLSAVSSIVGNSSPTGAVLPGLVVALSAGQVHLAFRQTRRTEPERVRAWMPWLTVGLYTLGLATIGLGVFGAQIAIQAT